MIKEVVPFIPPKESKLKYKLSFNNALDEANARKNDYMKYMSEDAATKRAVDFIIGWSRSKRGPTIKKIPFGKGRRFHGRSKEE